jgi:Domain of unknown function (DUF4190)
MRAVLQGTNLFLLVLLTALVGLSSCQRAHYALYAPTPDQSVRPVAGAATNPTLAPTTTASLDATPTFPVESVVTETAPTVAPVEPAIPTVVRRLSAWQKYKLLLRNPTAPGCDQIVLRNGDVVDAKIKEVGVNEIKYKKCDRQDGPDYTVLKRDVLSIKYSNGEVERFNSASSSYNTPSQSSNNNRSYSSPTNPQDDGPSTDPFAIVAISAGGLALLTGYGSFLFGAGALVFGALSLSRIRKEPGRFKGKGLAIAGMVIGIVAVAIYVLYYFVY